MVFIAILWVVLRKPVRIFFSTSRERIKSTMEIATKKRSAAEAHLQENEARIALLGDELSDSARRMEAEGKKERDAIVLAAQEKADAMYLDARRYVSREMARMYHDIYLHSVRMAFEMAHGDIQQRMDKKEAGKLALRSIDMISKGVEGML